MAAGAATVLVALLFDLVDSEILCYHEAMDDMQTLHQESAILARVIAPEEGTLPKQVAEALVGLAFPEADIQRMNELAEKNRQGEATEADLGEIEGYSRVGNLINLLQSKARQSLPNG